MSRWQKFEKEDLNPGRRFGARVSELRTQRGLSVNRLAQAAGVSASTISRLERGQIAPSQEHVARLSEALTLSKGELKKLSELVDLCEYERSFSLSENRIAEIQEIIRRREAEADEIKGFSWSFIPGLLQTSSYMRAIFASGDKREDVIAAASAARISRQEILLRSKDIQILLSEYCLMTRITSRAAHLEQLDALIQHSEAETVEIGVLPLEACTSFCVPCSFWIYDSSGGLCELFDADFCIWEAERVQRMLALFSQIKAAALVGPRFIDTVNKAKKRF